ncbi:MAG: HDOD domain-containing protein [Turneriella sp.]
MLEPAKLEARLREVQLPFQPQVLAAVLQLRDDTRMDFIELDRLIRSDQTIASLILKLANSSFYSRGHEIRTLPQAIGMIGFRTIVSIVTAASAKNIFLSGNYAKFRRYVWQHSLVTAIIGKIICEKMQWKEAAEEVFIGGLLHDIGKVILNQIDRKRYIDVINTTLNSGKAFRHAEKEFFGVESPVVGQLILKIWNLPVIYREVTVFLDKPSDPAMQRLPVHDQRIVRIVGLANLMAKMNEFGHLEADHPAMESEYLQPLGITPDGALMSIDWKKAVVSDTYYQVFSVIG